MSAKSHLGWIGLAVVTFAPTAALSQSALEGFGVESGVSTLGYYAAPNYKISDKFTARLPIYFGSMDLDEAGDLDDVDASFDTASAGLVADYHPFASAFRISGGVIIGGYNLKGDVTDPEIDGTVYTGTTSMEVKQKENVAPVLSFGFAKTFSNGVGIVAEIGAKIATYEITASSDFLSGADQANFEADLRDANADLADIPAVPFITLGLSYRF